MKFSLGSLKVSSLLMCASGHVTVGIIASLKNREYGVWPKSVCLVLCLNRRLNRPSFEWSKVSLLNISIYSLYWTFHFTVIIVTTTLFGFVTRPIQFRNDRNPPKKTHTRIAWSEERSARWRTEVILLAIRPNLIIPPKTCFISLRHLNKLNFYDKLFVYLTDSFCKSTFTDCLRSTMNLWSLFLP